MRRLLFQADGLAGRNAKRLKKTARAPSLLARQALIVAAVLAVSYTVSPLAIYIFNRPGRIQMTYSTGGAVVTILGTVEDLRVGTVLVDTNGISSSEPVVDGTFTLHVPASQTETVITTTARGATSVLTIPPRPPGEPPGTILIRITSPPAGTRTQNSSARIEGTVEGQEAGTIALLVNGVERPVQVNNGTFSSEVGLGLGENTVQARFENSTSTVVEIFRGPPAQIELTQPRNDSETMNNIATVSGRTEDLHSSSVTLYVNGQPVKQAQISNDQFAIDVVLSPGANTIRAEGAGVTSNSITVTLAAPPQPVIEITGPPNNTSTSDRVIHVAGNAKNLPANNITLHVNGQPGKLIRIINGQFESDVVLSQGANSIHAMAPGVISNSINITLTPPPQPTIEITSPAGVSSTNDRRIRIFGTAKNLPGSAITPLVNGRAGKPVQMSNGQFTADVVLRLGANTIQAAAGGIRSNSIMVTLESAQPQPAIEITSPPNNSSSKARIIRVLGSARNLQAGSITIYVNGQPGRAVQVSGGQFTASVVLSTGANTIQAGAAGVTSNSITVTLESPHPLPAIEITSPANNSSSRARIVRVLGSVRNLQAGALTLYVNGQPGRMVQISNGQFAGSAVLRPGANTIQAGAAGVTSNSITVTLEPPQPQPAIAITSPANNSSSEARAIRVLGSAQNLQADTIAIYVNGQPGNSVQTNNGRFAASVVLRPGVNTIQARAGGVTSNSIIVTLKTAAPRITITSPASGTTTGSAGIAVLGTVENQAAATITLRVNEVPQAVRVVNGAFSTTAKLKAGRNALQASLGGVLSNQVLVTLQAPRTVIRITSPVDGVSTQERVISVSGTVKNLQADAIIIYVNGRPGKQSPVQNGRFATEVLITPGLNVIDARFNGVRSQQVRVTLKQSSPPIK